MVEPWRNEAHSWPTDPTRKPTLPRGRESLAALRGHVRAFVGGGPENYPERQQSLPASQYHSAMPLASGAVFAGYTIVRLVGAGGMGEVYLATHPRLPRRDALKVLTPGVSADPEFHDRFIREADLAASLAHPHIVHVNDRGDFNGQLWIAMQYVDGTDTEQLMRDRYPAGVPADEVVTIITAVAGALDYAHQQGLLHRDVKPANILLTHPDDDGERQVFLADFGIARELVDPRGLTATNLTVGTVAYAAPEQLMGSDLDGRADEYALAATAFHLLTGAPLFQQSNPVAVISQHLTAAPPKLSEKRPELSALNDVMATALAKTPADRFATCRQFAAALRQATGEESISSRPTQTAVPVARGPLATPQPSTRRRAILTAAALVAVAAVAATAVVIYDHTTTRRDDTHATPVAAQGPTLDGTYRFVYDDTKMTNNGAPIPPPPPSATPPKPDISNSAFRSLCTATGCVATSTRLDDSNPTVAFSPTITSAYHYANNHWQTEQPYRTQSDEARCLGSDQKIGPGSNTVTSSKTLEPQPDGTLRGVLTLTYLTNECGYAGVVQQTPFVGTRIGDLPVSVTVADPAAVPATPPQFSSPPPAGGPIFDGAYRIELDNTQQTVNGNAETRNAKNETHWWAFRSSCTTIRCVAVGALLSDDNPQEPATGDSAMVLQFIDGHWQIDRPGPDIVGCDNGSGSYTVTASDNWSFQPQPDGTLRGFLTTTDLSNECSSQGEVFKTPVVATRISDVPPAVVVADPALFLS